MEMLVILYQVCFLGASFVAKIVLEKDDTRKYFIFLGQNGRKSQKNIIFVIIKLQEVTSVSV
jgi:hypothetical protein